MKLTVLERLVLLNVLPAEGDLTTIRIVRQMREALSFTEEEHAVLAFQQGDGGRVSWNTEAADECVRDIDLGPKAVEVARKALGRLNAEGKLTEQHLSVCDLFEVE